MKVNGKMTKTLIAAAITGAMILPATGALAASKTERAVIGAVLGGVAGAALSHGDGGATAVGAAAGALVGVATAKGKQYRHSYRETRPYYGQAQTYDRYGYGRDYYGRYDTRYDDRNDQRYDPYRRW